MALWRKSFRLANNFLVFSKENHLDRFVLPIAGDPSHNEMRFHFHKNVTEAQSWQRTFPNPLPSTHEYLIEWIDDFTISVKVVPKGLVTGAVAANPVAQPNVPQKHASPGSPADVEEKRVGALRSRAIAYAKMSENDLITRAAELGLKVSRSLSRATIADKIVHAEESLRLEKETKDAEAAAKAQLAAAEVSNAA